MSIHKLKSGRYTVRWRDPSRVNRQRTFDRKRDAETFEHELRRQRQLGHLMPRQDVVLAEYVEEWWERYAVPNLAASTRAAYAHTWSRHLLDRVGGYPLRQVSPAVVMQLASDLSRDRVGPATVRKALAVLQSVMRVAVLEQRIDFNPVTAVRKPRYDREREPHIFGPIDIEQLRARLELRDATLVSVLAYSGPRPEEALRLTWTDVGERSLHYRDTKRHRDRSTPLLAPLAADLKQWHVACGRPIGRTPVFPAHDGEPWQQDDWRNWRRRTWRRHAPEGTRPRDLRSSYITVEVYAGTPLVEIARHVGTSVQMIERHYFRVLAEHDGSRVPAAAQILTARADVRALFAPAQREEAS